MMKDIGTIHWDAPNTGATNSSGFSALPGGFRSGNCKNIGINGYWWANSTGAVMAYRCCTISNSSAGITNDGGNLISNGLSVRCVRD